MNFPIAAPIALLLLACFALPVQAERADRDKPIQVEARKITIDDAKKIQILEGDVVLTKGSLIIRAERVIITEDQHGFQKGTAFGAAGKLARFRQKREGREGYIDGEAERIEYNTSNEIAELFHRAWVKSGEDHVRGDYIWYDSISEKFLVTVGAAANSKGAPDRVRATIQPKNKTAVPAGNAAPSSEKLRLQGTQSLDTIPAAGPGSDDPAEKKIPKAP